MVETPRIRQVDPADRVVRGRTVDVLAAAFRDSPLNLAVIRAGPRRRLRSNAYGMRAMLASVQGRGLLLAATGESDLEGMLVAAPPNGFPMPAPPPMLQLRCLLGQGVQTVRRWGDVYRSLVRIHPEDPHWYLAVLGVSPERQRRGFGTALLRDFVRRIDEEGGAAYLECDQAANVPFYEHAGFQVVRETRALDVPIWCMWRDAR